MDDDRFDALTRTLGQPRSRRGALALAAGVLLAARGAARPNRAEAALCAERVPRPGYRPVSDFCIVDSLGKPGRNIESFVSNFRNACYRHDVCYQTCDRTKASCDTDFRDAMVRVCNTLVWYKQAGCRTQAEGYYKAVKNDGKRAYEESQATACRCCAAGKVACGTVCCASGHCQDGTCTA